MKRSPAWAAPWLLAALAAAQQEPPVPSTAPPTARARLDALQAEAKQLQADHSAKAREAAKKAKEAKDAGLAVPAMPMRPDFAPLVAKAKAAAEQYAGTDDAVGFLVFVVRNGGGDRETSGWAFERLADAHLEHPALAELGAMLPMASRLVGEDKVPALLDRLAASTNADLRGWALFARHKPTIDDAKVDVASERYLVAKRELQKAAELATNARLKQQIDSAFVLREQLGVGCTAPEIEGVDLDGVQFKLSDYRGKVVFLDFWGDW
jgi:hypothetical protein